jgi:hypothetical protein
MALTDAELCLAIYSEIILGQLQCKIAEGMRSEEGASKQLNTITQFLAENIRSTKSVCIKFSMPLPCSNRMCFLHVHCPLESKRRSRRADAGARAQPHVSPSIPPSSSCSGAFQVVVATAFLSAPLGGLGRLKRAVHGPPPTGMWCIKASPRNGSQRAQQISSIHFNKYLPNTLKGP